MKLPVLKRNAGQPEGDSKKFRKLAKRLLRKRVVIPVLACVLAAAFILG